MIPRQAIDLYSSQYSAGIFVLAALVLLVGAVWAAAFARRAHGALRGALAAILLGFCIAMSYEAVAVWRQTPSQPTISKIANDAFATYRNAWGAIFLMVILIGGLLTMHFTRVVQQPQQANWALLVTTGLFLLNGAMLAYWFNWLP